MRVRPPVQGNDPAAARESRDAAGDPAFRPALAGWIPRADDRPANAVRTIVLPYAVVILAASGPSKAPGKVELFDRDGNALGEVATADRRGACIATIDNGYAGPLLVKVSADGAGGMNFAGETVDRRSRRACLRAVTVASGRGNLALAVTPLTELAALSVGIAGDAANVHPAMIEAVNRAVGRMFGLGDVTGVRHGIGGMALSPDPAVLEQCFLARFLSSSGMP